MKKTKISSDDDFEKMMQKAKDSCEALKARQEKVDINDIWF